MKIFLVAAVVLVLTTRSVQPSPAVECEGDKVDKYVQDDADCSIYWLCGDGWASEYQCSNGLHFNVRRGECDAPRNAGCAMDTTDAVTNSPTSTSPVTSTSVVSDSPVTTPVTRTSLVTDRPVTTPVTRTSVVTDRPVTTPVTRTSYTTEPSSTDPRMICRAARPDRWHLPHPEDRTKFFKCDLNTGGGTMFSCPSGLVFNPSFQVCDWPSL